MLFQSTAILTTRCDRRKPWLRFSLLTLAALLVANALQAREQIAFDSGWRFHFGDTASAERDFRFGIRAPFAKAGAGLNVVQVDFDDHDWTPVHLPHDWAVELDFVHSEDPSVRNRGYKPIGREFPSTTVGWYRRLFTIPNEDRGNRLTVKFDGVFRDATVWINGHYLGRHASGYGEFAFDVTDYLNYGQKNALTVRVDASYAEGWFYEGAGIYRHVWLLKTAPLHVPLYGTYVRSELTNEAAHVIVQTTIANDGASGAAASLSWAIIDEHGTVVARATTEALTIAPYDSLRREKTIDLRRPALWSIETPHLYTLVTTIVAEGAVADRVETRFGIRSLRFDSDRGFFLNGQRVEIRGVCLHQDHAGVGVALPDRLQWYRLEKIKAMGANAVRTSHNPPAPALLEACDRLGLLVLDENRLMGTSPELMQEFERLILRDRNHPSVILWSIGNEEWVTQNSETGAAIARKLVRVQHQLDPGRLSTYAADNGDRYEGINSVVDVRGVNYIRRGDVDAYHRKHPQQPIIGTEESCAWATRGVYETAAGFVSDDDANVPKFGSTAEQWWSYYAARPWLAGAFVWSGFDYRGEPNPYNWPNVSAATGILDLCGFPKNKFFYYQSQWSDTDVLHLFPHWNWRGKEGKPIDVWCFSNAESVELFVNGKSLGRKTMPRDGHLQWSVPFEPGTLEARGQRDGRSMTTKIVTTGAPASVALTQDRSRIAADGQDVAVITVTALDAKDREVPDAIDLIHFFVDGPGVIIGVGNGDPTSHESEKAAERHLFSGKCQLIVQSGGVAGPITIRATAEGLKPAAIMVNASD